MFSRKALFLHGNWNDYYCTFRPSTFGNLCLYLRVIMVTKTRCHSVQCKMCHVPVLHSADTIFRIYASLSSSPISSAAMQGRKLLFRTPFPKWYQWNVGSSPTRTLGAEIRSWKETLREFMPVCYMLQNTANRMRIDDRKCDQFFVSLSMIFQFVTHYNMLYSVR